MLAMMQFLHVPNAQTQLIVSHVSKDTICSTLLSAILAIKLYLVAPLVRMVQSAFNATTATIYLVDHVLFVLIHILAV